jgi:hypothetical protein
MRAADLRARLRAAKNSTSLAGLEAVPEPQSQVRVAAFKAPKGYKRCAAPAARASRNKARLLGGWSWAFRIQMKLTHSRAGPFSLLFVSVEIVKLADDRITLSTGHVMMFAAPIESLSVT